MTELSLLVAVFLMTLSVIAIWLFVLLILFVVYLEICLKRRSNDLVDRATKKELEKSK